MRCAEDVGMGGEREGDARKIMAVLPKRFTRYGWRLPPTQTTLMAFKKPDAHQASANGTGTCDVRGFTQYWTPCRRGFGVVQRRPARKRLRRTTKSLWRWCRTQRPAPLNYQDQMLGSKRRGHFRYDGSRGNFRVLEEVRRAAEKAWRYWLSRRRRQSSMGWATFQPRLEPYVLPAPKLVHTI
jgi:RNA-directed DNA polymerase